MHSHSSALIDVVNANDIVLTKIAADLDFNQFQWNFSRVGEAMYRAYGDISGLVLVHQFYVIANRHFGCSMHDDPVLGPVMMFCRESVPPGCTTMRLTWNRSPRSIES